MTTLDERLRTAARNQTEFTPDQHICWQAADRIKQLEAQIEAVKEQITLMPQSGSGYDYWVNALLTALEESKDDHTG